MKKKKVLYVITKSNWGGAQRYVYDLATNLSLDAYEPVVALGGTGEEGAQTGLLKTRLEAAGIRTIFVPSFMRDVSLGKEFGVLRELVALFKAERPDVVHLNSSKAGGIGALAGRIAGIKNILFTSHGLAYEEDRSFLARTAIYSATWATFLLCHKVVLITQRSYERARWMPLVSRKLRLVHNGISPIAFLSREAARQALAPQAPSDALWVGALGELTWNKGVHHLLRAAGELSTNGKNFSTVIMGDGEERQFLQTIVEEEQLEGKVYFVGFVQDGATYLRAFDIFALSSVKEGLPYVLMEAGLAELAVVAADVGGVSDIIGDNISGLLAKSKNQGDLVHKLQTLIDDGALRKRLGEALKLRVEQEFSIAKMVESTKAVY